jgi:glycosyltransferase involved in cell wall biosynthesis
VTFRLQRFLEVVDAGLGVDSRSLNWKGRLLERLLRLRLLVLEPAEVARRVREFLTPVPTVEGDDAFLRAFVRRHRRLPRVLHVGNIANNAYLNAKLLNAAGYDCDVICYDYYHAMACPEWEEADFRGDIDDPLRPDWARLDLGGYVRPRWFAQGPQNLVIDYLIAKRRGHDALADALWSDLGVANRTREGLPARFKTLRRMWLLWCLARARAIPQRVWIGLGRFGDRYGVLGWLFASMLAPLVMLLLLPFYLTAKYRDSGRDAALAVVERTLRDLQRRFTTAFPTRTDTLTRADWAPYRSVLEQWAELFSYYDIVQAYSTDVAYPLLTGHRPYVGFEHGTLRVYTLCDSAVCRLTALGYREADHVLITNGDCLEYAHKIGVESFTPMLHPIDDSRIEAAVGAYDELHRHYGVDHLFLCPLRHDWAIKGTDHYIRALPGIASRIGTSFRVIMTGWGSQLNDSRALAEELGVADFIAWVEPMKRGELIRMQKSVDIVFDQIALPHFGATAPQAIAAGVPVIMSYEPESTKWIIAEPAPVLRAWSADDVVEAVTRAIDPAFRAQHVAAAKAWFDKNHSGAEAVRRLSAAYHAVCQSTGLV